MDETAPNTEKKSNNSPHSLPRIRTYAADMKRAIDSRGATLASIANTERTTKKKRSGAVPKLDPQKTKTLFFLFGAIILFVLGVLIVGVTYFLIQSSEQNIEQPQSIIFVNKTVTMNSNVTNLDEVLAALRANENLALGEIENIILTENDIPLRASDTARKLGLPDAVAREVTGAMVGVHAFDRNQPFIILEVSAYDRSFNALLSEEKNIGRNLGNFFAPINQVTSGNAKNQAPNLVFEDLIIRNADVRVSQDSWKILYTYPTRSLLIITTNEFTLREITTRYSNTIR